MLFEGQYKSKKSIHNLSMISCDVKTTSRVKIPPSKSLVWRSCVLLALHGLGQRQKYDITDLLLFALGREHLLGRLVHISQEVNLGLHHVLKLLVCSEWEVVLNCSYSLWVLCHPWRKPCLQSATISLYAMIHSFRPLLTLLLLLLLRSICGCPRNIVDCLLGMLRCFMMWLQESWILLLTLSSKELISTSTREGRAY